MTDGKLCSRCKEFKPWSEFSKDKQHWSGHKSACKLCAVKDFKTWRASNLERARFNDKVSQYKSNYGLSHEDALSLAKNRTRLCKICGQIKPLVVDHCHVSGKVRGYICSACNSMLGYAQDNLNTLQKAIEYLKGHYEL